MTAARARCSAGVWKMHEARAVAVPTRIAAMTAASVTARLVMPSLRRCMDVASHTPRRQRNEDARRALVLGVVGAAAERLRLRCRDSRDAGEEEQQTRPDDPSHPPL